MNYSDSEFTDTQIQLCIVFHSFPIDPPSLMGIIGILCQYFTGADDTFNQHSARNYCDYKMCSQYLSGTGIKVPLKHWEKTATSDRQFIRQPLAVVDNLCGKFHSNDTSLSSLTSAMFTVFDIFPPTFKSLHASRLQLNHWNFNY